MLAISWPRVCVSIKRWHDRNRPGWIPVVLEVVIVSCVILQSYYAPERNAAYWAVTVIGIGIGIWQTVECGCLDGTRGENRYGPSPKGVPDQVGVF